MDRYDWIAIAVVLGILVAMLAFDLWIRSKDR
jgi:hypothetical protein